MQAARTGSVMTYPNLKALLTRALKQTCCSLDRPFVPAEAGTMAATVPGTAPNLGQIPTKIGHYVLRLTVPSFNSNQQLSIFPAAAALGRPRKFQFLNLPPGPTKWGAALPLDRGTGTSHRDQFARRANHWFVLAL